jgi:signal recognition particle receptor subunit beta
VVAAVPELPPAPHLQPEHHAIVAATWEPISVVELAAKLDLAIGVVRVLLGDLRSAGLISLYEPPAASQPHDVDVLRRLSMDSVRSDQDETPSRLGRDGEQSRIPVALKILIAGGFGAGKTTMVGSVSEIRPLQTEEVLTGADGADDLSGIEGKRTTTVTMDFGRITITEDLQLYLFGTPGQDRFWFLWDELSQGALGAVVLADTRRLADCFPSIDYFEQRGTPFVIAVNCFDAERQFGAEAVGRALDLDPGVPVVLFDAREPLAARNVLIELVEYVARRQLTTAGR